MIMSKVSAKYNFVISLIAIIINTYSETRKVAQKIYETPIKMNKIKYKRC